MVVLFLNLCKQATMECYLLPRLNGGSGLGPYQNGRGHGLVKQVLGTGHCTSHHRLHTLRLYTLSAMELKQLILPQSKANPGNQVWTPGQSPVPGRKATGPYARKSQEPQPLLLMGCRQIREQATKYGPRVVAQPTLTSYKQKS